MTLLLYVSEAKKSYWPDINVNFLSAKNILNFRMTRADVLNRNSTPRNIGIPRLGGMGVPIDNCMIPQIISPIIPLCDL